VSLYWILRAWFPIASVAFVAVLKHVDGKYARWLSYAVLTSSVVGAIVLGIMLQIGFPLTEITGVQLSYESAIESLIYTSIIILLINDPADALLNAALGVSAVGFLYEWPLGVSASMIWNPVSISAPLIVNTQLISAALLPILNRRNLRFTWFYGALILYSVSVAYLYATAPQYYPWTGNYHRWLIRIPSYLLVASLSLGTRGGISASSPSESRRGSLLP
jgi:hypothetical protein